MTGAHRRTWEDNPKLVAQLRALHAEGLSYRKIAARLGVTPSAITGICHRLDLPRRPNPVKRDQVAPPKPKPPRRIGRGATLPPLGSLQ